MTLYFTQFYLSAIPDHLSPTVKSAAVPYIRSVSQGQQAFTPDMSNFPMGQPMTKLTAKLQVRIPNFLQYHDNVYTIVIRLSISNIITYYGRHLVRLSTLLTFPLCLVNWQLHLYSLHRYMIGCSNYHNSSNCQELHLSIFLNMYMALFHPFSLAPTTFQPFILGKY